MEKLHQKSRLSTDACDKEGLGFVLLLHIEYLADVLDTTAQNISSLDVNGSTQMKERRVPGPMYK